MIRRNGFRNSHNPYFNRWFSAILLPMSSWVKKIRHNPYFNRWFSAIGGDKNEQQIRACHNPYFNRWFSAMQVAYPTIKMGRKSQSLF